MSDLPFSEAKLAEDLVYKTLLESTLAIPWSIEWETKQFSYIGPQIEKLLGWTQDSWKSVEDWAMRMHEDERAWVVDYCVAQSLAGIDHEADYRAMTVWGDYIWIRDVVHVVRQPNGEVERLVGFMFDISERKRQEQELQALRKQLEEYSYQDGLTGIANRRLFNELFQREWLSAIRENTPFSMLMIDIDYFKHYNDHYGHMQGDECLQRVANVLKSSFNRPYDVVARYGGEEFMVILPNTASQVATMLAQQLMQNIKAEQIEHAASPISDYVTVSIGIKTSQVQSSSDRLKFLQDLDQALYRSKKAGRNRYLTVDEVG